MIHGFESTGVARGALGQPTTADAPDDRATEFKAVEAESGEKWNATTLVVEAYAAIWIIVAVWILMLWRKQASLTERLDGLERALDRAAAAAEQRTKKKETSKVEGAGETVG